MRVQLTQHVSVFTYRSGYCWWLRHDTAQRTLAGMLWWPDPWFHEGAPSYTSVRLSYVAFTVADDALMVLLLRASMMGRLIWDRIRSRLRVAVLDGRVNIVCDTALVERTRITHFHNGSTINFIQFSSSNVHIGALRMRLIHGPYTVH